jgi:hypothetical protein
MKIRGDRSDIETCMSNEEYLELYFRKGKVPLERPKRRGKIRNVKVWTGISWATPPVFFFSCEHSDFPRVS